MFLQTHVTTFFESGLQYGYRNENVKTSSWFEHPMVHDQLGQEFLNSNPFKQCLYFIYLESDLINREQILHCLCCYDFTEQSTCLSNAPEGSGM